MSEEYEKIADHTQIGQRRISTQHLPDGVVLCGPLGLVASVYVDGQVVHRARDPERGLFECRAEIMPNGDWLLLFPDGGHYGRAAEKVNDMLAYRSRDGGRTWAGEGIAFAIDYNQHGFVPLVPRGRRASTPSAPSRSGMSVASTDSGLKTGYTRMCRSDSAIRTTMDRAGPR